MVNHPFHSLAAAAAACVAVLAAAGCSPDKGLTDLSGTVTFQNAPVPAGVITIEPDPSRDGPQAAAGIANGRFKSRPNYGSVSGPVVIRVEGYTGKPEGESIVGRPLFPPYVFTADIPKTPRHVLDIVVPAD
jgi:hypothetical protein